MLSGPSDPPDPDYHAFRQDLADVALAGRVIAYHYAEPLERRLTSGAPLRCEPDSAAAEIAQLAAGESFILLDDSLGWAWGYGGPDRRVGYVRSDAFGES